MKRILIAIQVVVFILALAPVQDAKADNDVQWSTGPEAQGDMLYSPEELDDILAPIALYPDPLIAQILPAATFLDQINEAARYIRQYGNQARIDDQNWDVSVKAVAHYQSILFMMDEKSEWTASLGQAFINQEQDVTDAIQDLRAQAEAAGSLTDTPQQQVITEGDNIRIVPAQPDVIYVPQYDPQVVYVENAYPSYGSISFGIGFTIGAWLNRDFDWNQHRVYYHGWNGGGWVGRARAHIRVPNNIYINNNYRVINTNRRILQHNTVKYRADLRRNNVQIRKRQPTPAMQRARSQKPGNAIENRRAIMPGSIPRANVPQRKISPAVATPASLRPNVTNAPSTRQPGKQDSYRSREMKNVKPASAPALRSPSPAKAKQSPPVKVRESAPAKVKQTPAAAPARKDPSAAPSDRDDKGRGDAGGGGQRERR